MILLLFSFIIINFGLYCLLIEITYFFEIELLRINSCLIEITVLIDWISCFFLFCVRFIRCLVIFYRRDYIKGDKYINRFILLILIFILSIVLLIISPNLIRILLGWDGLGLVSYCLVIYYQNIKSYNAGILTALSNRIGDVIILLSIVWILNFGSWNYIFYLDLIKTNYEIQLIGILLVIAAITKRAQIPFSAWLPAAIAAPTPVSALVHSSTLVTAGIYLLIRFNNLIRFLYIGKILLLLGGLTIFMAGLGANYEFDLKKIIALSTLRQLGLIIRILSIGCASLAFFHLFTHALFKALLFICAGVIIHNIKNFQDIRYIGSLIFQIPLTIINFNIANIALCGVFFLAGFYSKDTILEVVSLKNVNLVSYFLYYFSTGLTVCYRVRLIYYTFFSNFNRWIYHPLNDLSWKIRFSIIGLLVITIFAGAFIRWLIFPLPELILLPIFLKSIVIFVCLIGGFRGYLISIWSIYYKSKIIINNKISWFLGSIWFLPIISTVHLNYYPFRLGDLNIKVIDIGWSEILGGQNLYKILHNISIYLQIFHINIKIFLIFIILWMIIFLMIFYLNSL